MESAAIVSEWLARPTHLVVVLVAALGVAWTFRLERERADRYEPFALFALGLAAIGHSAAVAGAASAARSLAELTEVEPLALLRVAQAALLGAVACGLVALAQLHVNHPKRRGHVFAICAVTTSACTAWIVQYFLVAPPAVVHDLGGIELARVERALSAVSLDAATARIDAEGRIELDGVVLPADAPMEQLVASLAPIARAMPQGERGIPDGALQLVVDRRAPFAALARLVDACAAPEVRVWKLGLMVEVAPRAGRARSQGLVHVLLPLALPIVAGDESESAVRVFVNAGDDGELVSDFEGARCADLAELTQRVRHAPHEFVTLHVPAELTWGALGPLLDALTLAEASLGGFVVAD